MNEQEIANRIKKLEKKNKVYGLFLSLFFIFIITGFYSNEIYKNIKTEKLELIDSSGTVRAELKMENGNPTFYLFDENGKERLVLLQDKDQTGLFILDSEGTVRIGTAQFSHGGGGYALHGPNSKGAAVLYLKENGSLTFYDEEGKVNFRVPDKK